MSTIIYEHPLNEKIRTYLRVEHLFNQLSKTLALEDDVQQAAFFTDLFALIEVLDRNDIRQDLLKDIERCETALVAWSRHPSVSDSKLQTLLQQAVRLQSELLKNGRCVNSLKEDNFLAPLRQRFFIPGGTCYFDLPQLQYWFNLPLPERTTAAQYWFEQIALIKDAVAFAMTFIRERNVFSELTAARGFYQNNTEQFELLRIAYSIETAVYPTVSGNKHRYAIRFMQLSDNSSRSACERDIPFALACC